MLKAAFVFFVVFLTAGVTVARDTLAYFGFDTNILLVTLLAIAITGLVAHARLLFIFLIVGMSVAINFPAFSQTLGISPDVLLATLLAIILIPLIDRLFFRY